MENIILLGIFLLFPVGFIVFHLRPLNNNEIEELATKRRGRQIRSYFTFDDRECYVNKEFKRKMSPDGNYYQVRESLRELPSLSAGLLKYKKHEWVIIAFEKNREVELIWLNKGIDRSSVSIFLSINDITRVAKENNYQSILIFHNHPNTNPNLYRTSLPSGQDYLTASEYASALDSQQISLLEFVCERGRHYEYWLSPTDIFFPISDFIQDISFQNGSSIFRNLSLHTERIFKRSVLGITYH